MNKKRREQLKQVINHLNDCASDLSYIKDDEDYTRENIPENLQGGDKYTSSEEASDKIDDAITDIESIVESLEEI